MDKASIVRLVLFVLAWVNTLLASKGYHTIPYVDETHVAMGVTFIVSVWGFVKHNFFGKKGVTQKEAINQTK